VGPSLEPPSEETLKEHPAPRLRRHSPCAPRRLARRRSPGRRQPASGSIAGQSDA
jgi:hypothetical protein